jgi:S1-C subfamily serine protease
MRFGVVVLCLVMAAAASAEPAQKQSAPVAARKAAKTKQTPKAAAKSKQPTTTQTVTPNPLSASYAALPLAARVSIQADLIMTGDYAGSLSGEFGNEAIAAVKAFQKRKGNAETGVLNPKERAELAAAAKPKQTARDWKVVDDTTAGVRLFVPAKMMPQASQIPGGSRWASARGEMAIETFRVASGATLAAVFEQMKKGPAGRRVGQSSMQADSFEISGLQNLKHFRVHGYARGDEVRGLTILYDQALEGIMPPVVTAMTNAFVAFPTGVAAPAAKSKVEYASGFAVSADGHIVTDREALEGCHVLTIAGIGGVDRVAEDKEKGLLLLRVYGARELKPVVLAGESTKTPDLTLLGITEPDAQGGGRAVSAAPARLIETRIEPPPGPGFTGAAVLDAQGKVTGMVTLKAALVAGTGAGPQAALMPVETIRNFLDAQNVAPAATAVTGEAAKASIVRVICVRK